MKSSSYITKATIMQLYATSLLYMYICLTSLSQAVWQSVWVEPGPLKDLWRQREQKARLFKFLSQVEEQENKTSYKWQMVYVMEILIATIKNLSKFSRRFCQDWHHNFKNKTNIKTPESCLKTKTLFFYSWDSSTAIPCYGGLHHHITTSVKISLYFNAL